MSSTRSPPLLASVGPGLAEPGDRGHVSPEVWALGTQRWARRMGSGRRVGAAVPPCALPQPSPCPRLGRGPRGQRPDRSSGSVLCPPGASGRQVAVGSHSPRRCPVCLTCLQLKTHMAMWLHFGEEGSIQFSSVAQSCLDSGTPRTAARQASLSISNSRTSTHAHSVQFSSVAQSCLTLCIPMNHSTPGLPVYHQLPEITQTHAHRVHDAIQPSHPRSSPSPPAPNPSQHQSLFQ